MSIGESTWIKVAAQAMTKQNIISPLLWLTLIVTPGSLVLLSMTDGWKGIFFAILASFPVLVSIVAFALAMWSNPRLLMSERHQERTAALACLGDSKFNPKMVVELIKDSPATNNPRNMPLLSQSQDPNHG
ncbi:hypothetical protein [Elioraea sp.]|uniref:hypothetical protein n=1 Tax=Elioraea sp. TaxID=2185103 RepID=UPI003F72848F